MTQFDSSEWRKERDAKLMAWVGDASAVAFFLTVADASEMFDDVVDQDKPIEDGQVERVLFNLLTVLPLNPFFDRHKVQLCAIMHTGINAWLDATEMEKSSSFTQCQRAYVLRDWNLELLMFVIGITRGRAYMREVSLTVRNFFLHETLDEYLEKLK